MVDDIIKTGVDDLIELLKGVDKISLNEVSEKLKTPLKTIQTWVDFFVEEKIIGIEYKFTVPYIYLNRSKNDQKKIKSSTSLQEIKLKFFEKAKKRNISEDQMVFLWNNKVSSELENQKPNFVRYAKLKGLENIDFLWDKFIRKIGSQI
jgi:hypothetical protein